MNKNIVKVEAIDDCIMFSDSTILYSSHSQDCCEEHYLDFDAIELKDFDGLLFDISSDDFFERVEDYGIRLKPINGHPMLVSWVVRNFLKKKK